MRGIDINRLNVVDHEQTVATSTTEGAYTPAGELNNWSLLAVTEDARVRFNRALVISTAPDAYFWDQSAGTWTSLGGPTVADPWDLGGMQTTDRLLIGVDGEIISALELTSGLANGNASVLAARYAAAEGYVDDVTWTAMRVASDGTSNGGATFGQTGRIVLGPPLDVKTTVINAANLVGRVWLELKVSAALDDTTTVTACTVLGQHRVLTAGTAESGQSRVRKVYHRLDANTGTLVITGQY